MIKGVQVGFEDGDLWLTQKSIGELFDTTRNNITMHINEKTNYIYLGSMIVWGSIAGI